MFYTGADGTFLCSSYKILLFVLIGTAKNRYTMLCNGGEVAAFQYDVIPVALGFRPKVILISKVYISSQEPDTEVIKSAASMYIDGVNCPGITFLDDGFTVICARAAAFRVSAMPPSMLAMASLKSVRMITSR